MKPIKNHQFINSDSGNDEYFTPIEIIEAARRVMGHIDLDPASSPEANKRINALRFIDRNSDGLKKIWRDRVWMNHPFGRSANGPWISKLIAEFKSGHVTEACCITFASTSEFWFRPLLAFPQCFLHCRTNYYLPDGTLKKGATKGSVITYLGLNTHRFAKEFSKFGTIKIVYKNL